jgi:K(+)-stimulated pyrophosphate-energized sodium pump
MAPEFYSQIFNLSGQLKTYVFAAILAGILALIYSFFVARTILRLPSGSSKMQDIASAIQEGASAYLGRQYRSICVVGAAALGLFLIGFPNKWIAVGFALGAILSGISGFFGMFVSVRGNVRTAEAARKGIVPALSVAFRSGAVTGFFVNGLGLLGVAGYMVFLHTQSVTLRSMIEALVALGFGASLISIFARLGGGIFTKGADVGADLVGKIEAGIPEDDPRNPAVIADNVGDNVGDCAGMSADLFETYVVTLVACMQMGLITLMEKGKATLDTVLGAGQEGVNLALLAFPLFISAACLVGCLAGTTFVRLKKSVMGALYKGLIASMGISGALISAGAWLFWPAGEVTNLVACSWIGLLTTGGLVWITEYYTASEYSPVRSIAQASVTGSGTNIIQGLAVSMEACFMPVLVVCAAILSAYTFSGLYGVATAATAMLAMMSMIIAIDAYGPVTDNAGGIAEMAGLPSDVRAVTDRLDAVGNTTKAITKGYSIGSAVLAAIVLFAAYTHEVSYYLKIKLAQAQTLAISFDLSHPSVIIGLLLGGSIPYLFGAMSMKAVGRAASAVVIEVRRQFKEIPGIMGYGQGQNSDSLVGRPDYARAVDLLTKASIHAMILPSLLPILLPIAAYGIGYMGAMMAPAVDPSLPLGATGPMIEGLRMVGGALLGMIITGFFVAVSMTSGGGAWDNAKKYIESGAHGGKGSPAYMAAVTGDTVGDPYKDTAGPAINPLIKIANLTALLMLAFL